MLYGDSVVCCMETVYCVVWRLCDVLYGVSVMCCSMETV